MHSPEKPKPISPKGEASRSDILFSAEREKQTRIEKEKKEKDLDEAEFEKKKQEILERLSAKEDLLFLKSLVERWLITVGTAEHIIDNEVISNDEIETLFQKIDEIEGVERIDEILPPAYRPTREAYIAAMTSEVDRALMLDQLQMALVYLFRSSGGGSRGGFFWKFLLLLSKSLATVQENLIDLQQALEKVDQWKGVSLS